MEDSAPNHVIGRGTLEVKPEMQAIYDEFTKVEERAEAASKKIGLMFQGAVSGLERANELADQLVAKMAEVRFDVPEEKRSEQSDRELEAYRVPDPGSQEAVQELEGARDTRWKEDILEEVKGIRADVQEMLNRDPE